MESDGAQPRDAKRPRLQGPPPPVDSHNSNVATSASSARIRELDRGEVVDVGVGDGVHARSAQDDDDDGNDGQDDDDENDDDDDDDDDDDLNSNDDVNDSDMEGDDEMASISATVHALQEQVVTPSHTSRTQLITCTVAKTLALSILNSLCTPSQPPIRVDSRLPTATLLHVREHYVCIIRSHSSLVRKLPCTRGCAVWKVAHVNQCQLRNHKSPTIVAAASTVTRHRHHHHHRPHRCHPHHRRHHPSLAPPSLSLGILGTVWCHSACHCV
jgi:hypothetical protein